MSEEEKGNMDKKSNPRQSSAIQKQNGSDSKKDLSSRNQRWGKRRGQSSSGNNFSYNEGQTRKPAPQKYRNSWDKRPQPRSGSYSDRTRSNLEEDDLEAEYGSAIQSGSKKGNLNHLLNFSYAAEHDSSRGRPYSSVGYRSRGRQIHHRSGYSRGGSKVYYNKEQFLQANCQFVVKEAGDYSIHMMDPDILVNWEAVEQVRVVSTEPPSCPICLQYPIAAKMTRCGHIYCWACILHYLALGEKSWRKCPICYESIHSDDLKSVVSREVRNYKVGDPITMTLMKKEKGSIYAVPSNLWQKREHGTCHNVKESEEMTRHLKLLMAQPSQVLELLNKESDELVTQRQDAEPSEEPFIKGAQDQLNNRIDSIKGSASNKQGAQKKCDKNVGMVPQQESAPEIPVTQHISGDKKIKIYKSAFSDEEEEIEESSEKRPAGIKSESAPPEASDASSDKSSCTATDTTDKSGEVSAPCSQEELVVGSPEGQITLPVDLIPDIMPVEEAAEHLELPGEQQTSKGRNKSGDHCFYFYQADDGQHIYLHSLNARCLVREFGSLENCPQKITANIVEKESVFVTEELRKRLRYLSHLPLTCGFEVVELAIKPPVVSKDTLKHFSEDFEKRRRMRQRKARDDKRAARRIEEEERKMFGYGGGTIVHSQFHQPAGALGQLDHRSDTSSLSLDTPVGSPSSGVDTMGQEGASGTVTEDDGQTAVVSFAQMLKAGSKAPVWPKVKSESSPLSPRQHGSDESDNEDKVPVPEYQSSFGSAIEAALVNINTPNAGAAGSNNSKPGGSGKKKKKQLVLFSTSMARGGK